ncbi:hypothetical protein [Zavarzinia compransoris]|uniref:hypothetical protein n=1 Tax=Zavarzinia compransoris TaxID=1264899 RepID=UPI00105D0455|nr:hypothetical protein [Zavarzinia compransoris]
MYKESAALTQYCVHGNRLVMGRRKLWHESVNLTLPLGAKARMDSVLNEGEDRLDLIREAIEREVKRRERKRLPQDKES